MIGYKLNSPKLMPLLQWKVLVWSDRCRFERRLRINRKRLERLRPERVLELFRSSLAAAWKAFKQRRLRQPCVSIPSILLQYLLNYNILLPEFYDLSGTFIKRPRENSNLLLRSNCQTKEKLGKMQPPSLTFGNFFGYSFGLTKVSIWLLIL